jgi:DNA polymerase
MDKFGLQKELKTISQIHGKVFHSESSYGKIAIVPLYHPAVALYKNGLKDQLFKDFEKIKTL